MLGDEIKDDFAFFFLKQGKNRNTILIHCGNR